MQTSGFSFISVIRSLAQLVRLPNVLIIILTQVLLRYCIIKQYLFPGMQDAVSPLPDFLLLVLLTVLIAVGGYIINDYFDVKIDRVNRPDRLVVNRLIRANTAIKLHMLLNGIAILLGFYLSWRIKVLSFGLIFPFISGLLWIYSARYKRVFFWGNFIVAALSAFVILVVWLFEFFWLRMNAMLFTSVIAEIRWVTIIFIGYALFAFLVSLVREIFKDMEDAEGDALADCRTLPISLGIRNSKFICGGILLVTLVLLVYSQAILFLHNFYAVSWYFVFTVEPLTIFLLYKLFTAENKKEFHFLSSLCKLIMLAGILSMLVIFISN
ncbi:MAG: geranylgeranylglycerol-phosphate geranylgeranyltransferase [bacterium]